MACDDCSRDSPEERSTQSEGLKEGSLRLGISVHWKPDRQTWKTDKSQHKAHSQKSRLCRVWLDCRVERRQRVTGNMGPAHSMNTKPSTWAEERAIEGLGSRKRPNENCAWGKTNSNWQFYEIFCTCVPSLNSLAFRYFYSYFINDKEKLLTLTQVVFACHLTSIRKFTGDIMQDMEEMAYFSPEGMHALYS